ncbi:MAG TPA: DinB family protein [Candidatus Saccharimonadales bacterium]|nr:DinB family protein [Candidatus Saccharimonadales bacterium]
MHPSILHAVQIQNLQSRLFLRALEGVTDAEARRPTSEHTNPLAWIAGHLVTTRCYLARVVGLPREIPWGGMFARGAALEPTQAAPSLEEIRAAWDDVTGALMARFEQLGEAELSGPVADFPSLDRTVRGALAMAAMHDSYHVGQLSLVRKALGHERLVG